MTRVLSGIQPTGTKQLGNYVGAIRQWAIDQHKHDAFFCVVDLHALTIEQDPAELRAQTAETATILVAAGLDPDACTLFVQSHVPEHPRLCWLLECVASFGELRRMTQFKDKTAKGGEGAARVGLFTYPVLQAADILLYDADEVPVGEDQRQHVELARDIAIRFNQRYGETFTVPRATIPTVGARVMDLQEPTKKMSTSLSSPQGLIYLLEPPESITGTTPGVLAERYSQYGPLKSDTAEAVVEFLRPLQTRYAELKADPGFVHGVLEKGAAKAEAIASSTYERAADAMGLLPR